MTATGDQPTPTPGGAAVHHTGRQSSATRRQSSDTRRASRATRRASAGCVLAALLACLVNQWLSHWPSFHPSLLLDISANRPIAPYVLSLDPGFVLSQPGERYDGVYYWAMAVDPFAHGQAHQLIDLSGYRYGHPLYGWLAGALSLGHAAWLPEVFWLLSVLTMASAAWFVSRLAVAHGASAWTGLVVAASPGLLFSSSSALTEAFQLSLVAATLLEWRRPLGARPALLALLLVTACLAKEQLVLLPLALAADLGVRWIGRRGRPSWRQVAALTVGPAALLAWHLYLTATMTTQQMDYPEQGNIGLPFSQFPAMLRAASGLRVTDDVGAQVGGTFASLLVASAVVLLVGAIAGVARRDALGWFVALQTLLMTGLGWQTLLFPHEMLRNPSVAVSCALISCAAGAQLHREPDATAPRPRS